MQEGPTEDKESGAGTHICKWKNKDYLFNLVGGTVFTKQFGRPALPSSGQVLK